MEACRECNLRSLDTERKNKTFKLKEYRVSTTCKFFLNNKSKQLANQKNSAIAEQCDSTTEKSPRLYIIYNCAVALFR